MKIPEDAIIPLEKLKRYLLIPRPFDDKSKFLAQAGFTLQNSDDLMSASRLLAIGQEGTEDGTNDYGTFYRVEGAIVSPDGYSLAVVTIWLRWHSDGSFHFVTLKPWKVPRP
jgi:hypothetical protein